MATTHTAAFHLTNRQPSVLVMSDRLISLAQDADRGGYSAIASQLVVLAHKVFDDSHA